MKAPRTLIREAVRERLVANLPEVDERLTASRISIHRTMPLVPGKLPALLITTATERIEDTPNAHPGLRYRKLELAVDVVTTGSQADEEAETIAQAVEGFLDADDTLGTMIEGLRLTRTDLEYDLDGDTPVLGLRLLYEVSYWTRPLEDEEAPVPLQMLISTLSVPRTSDIGLREHVAEQPAVHETFDQTLCDCMAFLRTRP